jgi:hypothetical protein
MATEADHGGIKAPATKRVRGGNAIRFLRLDSPFSIRSHANMKDKRAPWVRPRHREIAAPGRARSGAPSLLQLGRASGLRAQARQFRASGKDQARDRRLRRKRNGPSRVFLGPAGQCGVQALMKRAMMAPADGARHTSRGRHVIVAAPMCACRRSSAQTGIRN